MRPRVTFPRFLNIPSARPDPGKETCLVFSTTSLWALSVAVVKRQGREEIQVGSAGKVTVFVRLPDIEPL